jgi:RND superfamily putative drug exporter
MLGILTAPILSRRLGMVDNGTLSEDLTTRRAYDLLAEGFGSGSNGPLVLSGELDGGATVADLAPLEAALAADPGIASVAPVQPNDDGTAAVIQAVPDTSRRARRRSTPSTGCGTT